MVLKKNPLSKLGIRSNFFNLINGIYEKPTVSIIPDSELVNSFLLRSDTRQGCSLSALLYSTSFLKS